MLLCPDCSRARAGGFRLMSGEAQRSGVFPGSRHSSKSPWEWHEELLSLLESTRLSEGARQIDPTVEEPADFLAFDPSGRITARRNATAEEQARARHTISVFLLNGPRLTLLREAAASSVRELLRPAKPPAKAGAREAIAISEAFGRLPAAFVSNLSRDYLACKTSAFIDWLRPNVSKSLPALLPVLLPQLDLPSLQVGYVTRVLMPILAASTRGPRRAAAREPSAASPPPARMELPSESAYQSFSKARITKVTLTNFRHFRSSSFEIPVSRPDDSFGPDRELTRQLKEYLQAQNQSAPEPQDQCGWKMLLGENGVGKSSILQAIGIALMADQKGVRSIPERNELHHSISENGNLAVIEVCLDDRDEPLRVTLAKRGIEITGRRSLTAGPGGEEAAPLFVRGYGATRLLPPLKRRKAGAARAEPKPQELGNLFDPYRPLANPNEWLQALDPDARRLAFIALKDVLDLGESARLGFSGPEGKQTLHLSDGGPAVPLSRLSSGYQSVVVLACDIMAGFGKHVGDMLYRTGIVLLDEIGTNLHPRWRLRIVNALRRTFPQIQFIASTHEPLCLRGLGKGEVALLHKDADRAVELRDRDLPSPGAYRVDQLLTGDFFGLETAYDPDEEMAFDVYHKLLVDERASFDGGPKLPKERMQLLLRLGDLLKQRLNLGDTAAERRLLSALEISEEIGSGQDGKRELLKGSPEAMAAANRLLERISTPSLSQSSP